MAVDIKRVSYSYNSLLEDSGAPAYFLDVLVSRDGETLVDLHKSYESRDELYQAMEEVVPVLEDVCEDREEQTQDELRGG